MHGYVHTTVSCILKRRHLCPFCCWGPADCSFSYKHTEQTPPPFIIFIPHNKHHHSVIIISLSWRFGNKRWATLMTKSSLKRIRTLPPPPPPRVQRGGRRTTYDVRRTTTICLRLIFIHNRLTNNAPRHRGLVHDTTSQKKKTTKLSHLTDEEKACTPKTTGQQGIQIASTNPT